MLRSASPAPSVEPKMLMFKSQYTTLWAATNTLPGMRDGGQKPAPLSEWSSRIPERSLGCSQGPELTRTEVGST